MEVSFLAKHGIPVLDHPHYSPDLTLCDFSDSKLKSALKGKRYATVEAKKEKVVNTIKIILQDNSSTAFVDILHGVLQGRLMEVY